MLHGLRPSKSSEPLHQDAASDARAEPQLLTEAPLTWKGRSPMQHAKQGQG